MHEVSGQVRLLQKEYMQNIYEETIWKTVIYLDDRFDWSFQFYKIGNYFIVSTQNMNQHCVPFITNTSIA